MSTNPNPEQWYVWLVWYYEDTVEVGDRGPMLIVGVFSSRDKALEAARSGCAITMLSLDDAVVGRVNLPVEWVS